MEKMEAKHPELFRQMPRVRTSQVPAPRPYTPRSYTGKDPVARAKMEAVVIKAYAEHGSIKMAAQVAICSDSAVAHILERRGIRPRVPRGGRK